MSRYRIESYADDPTRFYVYTLEPSGAEVIHADNLTHQAAQREALRLEQAAMLAESAPELLEAAQIGYAELRQIEAGQRSRPDCASMTAIRAAIRWAGATPREPWPAERMA